jgi:ComF family protein
MDLHFVSARSAVIARGVALEAIHRFKYNQAEWFAPFLTDLLVRVAGTELRRADWDFIVPVPLHPLKQRERGFNQAERLADPLSACVGIPTNRRMLQRHQVTRTQTLLTRPERAENVRGAFHTRAGIKLHGERIVLVDDVFTTGATTNACAATLQAAGAGAVCVWTLARGL